MGGGASLPGLQGCPLLSKQNGVGGWEASLPGFTTGAVACWPPTTSFGGRSALSEAEREKSIGEGPPLTLPARGESLLTPHDQRLFYTGGLHRRRFSLLRAFIDAAGGREDRTKENGMSD